MSIQSLERLPASQEASPIKIPEVHPRLAEYITVTQLSMSSSILPNGAEFWVKHEGNQVTGSFKICGVGNKVLRLVDEGHDRFVIASAGSAAAAASYMANRLGIIAEVHAPNTIAPERLSHIEMLGGQSVRIHTNGYESFDDAYEGARISADTHGLPMVPPFDDLDVIAGNATVIHEILERFPDRALRLFVGVGGSGLLASGLVASSHRSDVRIIGAQMAGNDSASRSIQAERIVPASGPLNAIAAGSAVNKMGKWPFFAALPHRARLGFVTLSPAEIGRQLGREIEERQELEPVLGQLAWDCFPETTALLAEASAHQFALTNPANEEIWVAVRTGSNVDQRAEDAALAAYHDGLVRKGQPAHVLRGMHTA